MEKNSEKSAGVTKGVTPVDDNTCIEIKRFLQRKEKMKLGNLTITNYTIEKMKDNAFRQMNLGGMYFAESGDKVRFLYNDSWREGLIDYIWKWGRKWATCYMTVEFNDGMEDVENSSYKNFSLDKVKGFEVIRKGE